MLKINSDCFTRQRQLLHFITEALLIKLAIIVFLVFVVSLFAQSLYRIRHYVACSFEKELLNNPEIVLLYFALTLCSRVAVYQRFGGNECFIFQCFNP